jgi:protein-disulfide isomerase
VYRYFPLTSIHPDAFGEAKAVDCVGKLAGGEKRRDYINKIFEYKTSQKNMVLKKGDTVTFAKELGVDEQQFTTCVNNPETDAIVNSALQDGVNAGVQGTPASMVLKKKGDRYELVAFIDGARQYDYFKAAIEEALSR